MSVPAEWGKNHIKSALAAKNIEVTAVCDIKKKVADEVGAEHGLPVFYDHHALFKSGLIDAVMIVTPHYAHTTVAVDGFAAGYHVISDKPMAVHKADGIKMLDAQKASGKKFGVMFQLRTSPANKKFKELLESGELGEIKRINWIITTWLRTQQYFNSGDWRASWRGEGGGALLNQCPHQLDLFQWFFGMPSKVTAFCHLGKYHNIEVEDEVTAYMEFADGKTAVFVTSTAEAPGTNRLEVTCDRGRLVLEDGVLNFKRTEASVSEVIANSKETFPTIPVWDVNIPVPSNEISATEVFEKFADAVLNDREPIVTGADALNELELGNAMLLSSLLKKEVKLPLDAALYEAELMKLVATSSYKPV